MGIDTENKRRSVLRILPVPDGVIDAADRQQSTRLYSGILVGIGVAANAIFRFISFTAKKLYRIEIKI